MRALRSTLFNLCCIINICLPASQAHGAYCSASGGCDEYIYAVQAGTINNTSAVCSSYADYTSSHSTLMEIGTGYATSVVTAIGGTPYSGYIGDQCGIWVDWNQDRDFYDLNETVYTASGYGLFTTTITPPAGAVSGKTRMRVRLMYTGTLSPCGYVSYGEVEDYTVTIQSSIFTMPMRRFRLAEVRWFSRRPSRRQQAQLWAIRECGYASGGWES